MTSIPFTDVNNPSAEPKKAQEQTRSSEKSRPRSQAASQNRNSSEQILLSQNLSAAERAATTNPEFPNNDTPASTRAETTDPTQNIKVIDPQNPQTTPVETTINTKAEEKGEKTWVDKFLANDFLRKVIPKYINIAAIGANMVAGLAGLVLDKSSIGYKSSLFLGEVASRVFTAANGAINFIERLPDKNYINALGNLGDVPFGLLAPRQIRYFLRGITVGLYSAANCLSKIVKATKFESLEDNLVAMAHGLKLSWKTFRKAPIQSLFSSESGILGTMSSIFMSLSPFVWGFTKFKTGAQILRDVFGATLDFEKILAGNLRKGRIHYVRAGLCYITGTLSDMASKILPNKYKDIFVTANMFADSVGRLCLRSSNNAMEMENKQDVVQIASLKTNPLGFIRDYFSAIINFAPHQKGLAV